MGDNDASKAQPPNTQWAIEGPVFQTMEEALEKLKVLDYEKRYCQARRRPALDRTYFAIPAKNPSMQLQSFLDLVSWLIMDITNDENCFKIDKYDDPNTSANKLLLAMRNLKFSLDFPVTKLKQAHGEAVCSVLDFLCERALQQKGFSWQRPSHRQQGDAEEAEVDDEADVGDLVDEAPEEEEEDFNELVRGNRLEAEEGEAGEDRKVVESTVDPIKWKTELERVGARLKVPQTFGGREWREHVEQTKRNEETIQKVFNESRVQLQVIAEDLGSALSRLGTKENYINSQFDHLKSEFGALKRELKDVEGRHQELNGRVGSLTNNLSSIVNRLEEIKDTMNDRGQSMSDASPLVRIRAALQTVKAEVQAFDLRIGVVEHTLTQAQIKSEKQYSRKQHKHKPRQSSSLPDLVASELSETDTQA